MTLHAMVKGIVPTHRTTVSRFCSVVSALSLGSAPTRPAHSTRLRIHGLIGPSSQESRPPARRIGEGWHRIEHEAHADAGDRIDGIDLVRPAVGAKYAGVGSRRV